MPPLTGNPRRKAPRASRAVVNAAARYHAGHPRRRLLDWNSRVFHYARVARDFRS